MEKEIKNKVKICFFSPASYPFFEEGSKVSHGGAELQMYLLAKFLSNNSRYNLCFFVGKYGKKPSKKGIEFILTIKNKKKEAIFLKILKAIKYLYQLSKANPDIIISTSANAFVGINSFYAKIFKKKFVYRSAHQMDVNEHFIKKNWLSGKIYKYGLNNANQIITQNEEHNILLKKHHNIEGKVLKNAIIIDEINPIKKDYVLWVGRFEDWKQPELFLQMAKNFSDKQFVMICPHTTDKKQEWSILNNKVKKINNLTLYEKIAFNKIQDYFNRAQVFVNTSKSEGFPNTFLQAALGKTPIISLNVNPDNFILEYNCGIFCNNNFEDLLIQSEELLNKQEDLKIKGNNLFQYLKKNHDIENVGKEFTKIIDSLK